MNLRSILFLISILLASYSQMPAQFSWDNINGTSFLPPVHSQHTPNFCNSAWAFSSIDVFNSRMKIMRKGASPDLQISAQVLLSCDDYDFGCMAGEPSSAFRWIKKFNITDSSCQTYVAKGHTNGFGCSSQRKCQICIDGVCKGALNSKIYSLNDFGLISGQDGMMKEINSYGPIACGLNSIGLSNYSSGIVRDNNSSTNVIDHHVLVYGWGVQNQTKFWKVKNSWGSSWGQKGHFRIERGKNVLGIQSRCAWGSPLDTWTKDIRNKTIPNQIIQNKNTQLSYQLPLYLTPSRSAVTPHDCTSSWAFATIQMIADRQSKKSNGKFNSMLSIQGLFNCGVGSCSKGGSPIDALVFIQKYGLPDESCQYYNGSDPQKQVCSGPSNCGSCSGTLYQFRCSESKNYKRWKITDYGFFSGEVNMKNQLYQGPIVCGIHASQQLKKYKGGIFSQISITPKIDHYVEVIGWGNEGGKNYWLCRNFWGTSWGESSMFRIQMGSNNLGIETKCYFAKGLV